ncbi:MAG: hypothetical protein R2781_01110 [Flavobacteriaceae bacterium]
MRPQIVPIVTLLLFLLNSFIMLGQSTTASSGPPPPAQRTPPELPIDGSLYLLLALGILYGIYALLKMKKANETRP